MIELTKSKAAMTLASIAALVFALGYVLAATAAATFSGYQSVQTYRDLVTASYWLLFSAGAIAWLGTALLTWQLFVARKWEPMWEAAGASLSTLLFAIGLLVVAAQSPNSSSAGHVVAAVGVGGWAIVVLVSAGRRALHEQEHPGAPQQAILRLSGAASLVVLAISVGFPNPSLYDATLAISIAVIAAVGMAGLAIVISLARSRRMIVTSTFLLLALGLWLLVLGSVAETVGNALVYGIPPPSLLTFRLGLSIPAYLLALAILVLAWTAFNRRAELGGTAEVAPTGSGPGPYQPPWVPQGPPASWQTDPTHRNQLRWWDGVRWTDHVLNGNQPSLDPLPSPEQTF